MFTDDHDIERELKAALGVRPSAGFEVRVLEAVAQETRTRRVPWTWLGVAAAVLLAAGAWALSGRTTVPVPESVVTRVNPPAIDPPGPGEGSLSGPAGSAVPRPPAGRRTRLSPAPERQGAAEPEVLVPANQLALIDAFAREINGGRVGLPEVADADARLQILVVPEMTVQPIAIATLEAGGPGPGSKGLQQ